MKTLKLFALVAAALAAGCGAVSNGEKDNTNPNPTPTPGGSVTVADVQKGNVEENSSVTLEALVVVAVKIGGAGVDFWAQDAGGGAQSGIYFFDQGGNTPADIAVGDEVTVTGIYKEFYDLSEITVDSVEITNNGLTPSVDTVPVGDLANPAQAEVWESCLIEVTGTALTVGGSVNQYNEFPVTDGTSTVLVDDFLYDGTAGLGAGATVNYLAGIVNYSFEEWKLLPRAAEDLEIETAPVVPVTIADIQNGTVTPEGSVSLEGLVVTAVKAGTGFWAQDVGGGAYSGLYFFDQQQDVMPADLAVGDEVSVSGVYKEFYGLSEVVISEATKTASGLTVTVDTVAIADLADPTSAEAWESCLVDVTSANPLSVGGAANEFKEFPVTDGADTVPVDDFIYDASADFPQGTDVSKLSGVVNYHFDVFKVLPRTAADITKP